MTKANILPGFWYDRLAINAGAAIFHQWEQLEASGSIENFRIAAGEVDGFREGWFFADSDAFKWLDAAARVYATHPEPRLATLMDDFIDLDRSCPAARRLHLHLQPNPFSRYPLDQSANRTRAVLSRPLDRGRGLALSSHRAHRPARDCPQGSRPDRGGFQGKGPEHTPGHQEIEIALLRLFQVTGQADYLEMARQFIEQRGRERVFGLSIFQQNSDVEKRDKEVKKRRQAYMAAHPEFTPFQVPAGKRSQEAVEYHRSAGC